MDYAAIASTSASTSTPPTLATKPTAQKRSRVASTGDGATATVDASYFLQIEPGFEDDDNVNRVDRDKCSRAKRKLVFTDELPPATEPVARPNTNSKFRQLLMDSTTQGSIAANSEIRAVVEKLEACTDRSDESIIATRTDWHDFTNRSIVPMRLSSDIYDRLIREMDNEANDYYLVTLLYVAVHPLCSLSTDMRPLTGLDPLRLKESNGDKLWVLNPQTFTATNVTMVGKQVAYDNRNFLSVSCNFQEAGQIPQLTIANDGVLSGDYEIASRVQVSKARFATKVITIDARSKLFTVQTRDMTTNPIQQADIMLAEFTRMGIYNQTTLFPSIAIKALIILK